MIKILVLAITVSVIGVIIRSYSKEFFIPFSLCAASLFLIYIFDYASEYILSFTDTLDSLPVKSDVLKVILKVAFISVATKLSCDICRESGNLIFVDIVELGGKMMIFIISFPYLIQVLDISLSFIK